MATRPKTAERDPARGEVADAAAALSASAESSVLSGGGSLEQIREILFGVEKSEYERRFRLLEAQVAEQGATLAGELRDRLASLSGDIERALDALRADLSSERAERADGAKQLARELKQASAATEKQLARASADVERRLATLSARLTDEAQSLGEQMAAGDLELTRRHGELEQRHDELEQRHDELEQRHEAHAAELSARSSALDDAKADRRTLAALLRDVADRLSDGSETAE